MVGPSSRFAGGAAGNVGATSIADSARMTAMRALGCGLLEFDIMGTRAVERFDTGSRYSFEFSLLLPGTGAGGCVAPLAGALAGEPGSGLPSPANSLVAWAAICAMFR